MRLGDIVQTQNIKSPGVVISGYPDDEGVALNAGRIGAALGPDVIRKNLYKLTPHLQHSLHVPIFDIGNLNIDKHTLKERHLNALSTAREHLDKNFHRLSFGGGHDYAYPDGAAYCQWSERNQQTPLIINFDAHLDVRSPEKGLNSGTPFYRLMQEFPHAEVIAIGIQPHCNSQKHDKWFRDHGGKILDWPTIAASGDSLEVQLSRFLAPYLLKRRSVFVSVDIDGFDSSYAMGCSQSWPIGFTPSSWLNFFQILCQRLDVRCLGIYEVAPPLDSDERTAKLAALIAHRWLYSLEC